MLSAIKNPRVLHIITLFSIGGATETVVSIANGLQLHGYNVCILTGPNIPSEGNMFDQAETSSLKVIIFPSIRRKINPIFDLIALFQLTRFINKGDYQIVHTHSSKAGIIGRLAARLAGIQCIIHTIHGLPFHEYQRTINRKLYIIIERFAARFTSKLIAVSHRIVADALKAKVGKADQYIVIRSGFDIENFKGASGNTSQLKSALRIQSTDFVIGKISRLSRLKGHEDIIRLMPQLIAEFPKIKVLFVGDGEIRQELTELVKLLRLEESVIFAGMVSPGDIPNYLAIMDMVVHTSLHEGLARVIAQALFMGKPVISYNLDGSPEVINDHLNGRLVTPLHRDELYDAIKEIILGYDTFVKNCSNGRDEIAREFDADIMIDEIIHLYTGMIQSD
ncbi:MAG: glycosyltransferase family 4 protein [Bacteroidota bacterium]